MTRAVRMPLFGVPSYPRDQLPSVLACGQKGGFSPCSSARGLRVDALPLLRRPLTSAPAAGLPDGRSAPRNIGLADLSKEQYTFRATGITAAFRR